MEPDSTHPGWASRAARAARASTPGVKAEGALVKHPRQLSRELKAKMWRLTRDRRYLESPEEVQKWEEEVRAVKDLQREVDEARKAFGFPFIDSDNVLQNARTETPASMFEEVLSRTLFELGLEKEEVDNVVQKSEARASTPGDAGGRQRGTRRGQQGRGDGFWGWSSSQGWQWRSRYS